MTTRVLLLAHGSPDSRHARDLRILARSLGDLGSLALAYLDHHGPSAPQALGGAARAVIVPIFLSAGFHVRHDVPRVAAELGIPHVVTPPLGPDAALADAVAELAGGRSNQVVDPSNPAWRELLVARAHADHEALVVPFVLAHGVLRDRVTAAARDLGVGVVDGVLAHTQVIQDLVSERIREGLARVESCQHGL